MAQSSQGERLSVFVSEVFKITYCHYTANFMVSKKLKLLAHLSQRLTSQGELIVYLSNWRPSMCALSYIIIN